MRSGAGVLCISALQLLVGLCLLGIYEGYKHYYYVQALQEKATTGKPPPNPARVEDFESPLSFRSPMGFIFYLAVVNNIFSFFGLAGVLNGQRELIIAFFTYNTAQMVVSFHYFVDLCTDAGVNYAGEPKELSSYEKAAAAFIFFSFVLSGAATYFAIKAVDEIKAKQREEFSRFTVLSDNLQYEPDHA